MTELDLFVVKPDLAQAGLHRSSLTFHLQSQRELATLAVGQREVRRHGIWDRERQRRCRPRRGEKARRGLGCCTRKLMRQPYREAVRPPGGLLRIKGRD